MKKLAIIVAALVVFCISSYLIFFSGPKNIELPPPTLTVPQEASSTPTANSAPVSVFAEGLSIPWDIVFLSGGEIMVTERSGRISFLKAGVQVTIPNVTARGEGGLLGAVLHPNFAANRYIYLYHTLLTKDPRKSDAELENRVVRYRLEGTEFIFDKVIIENLPGANYHDGGRIAFGPDGYLYITVGDAGNERSAQDPYVLSGSILRITDEGQPAPGNPFGTAVYSYGHRNPQGLAWDEAGNLWSTEHGRSGIRSGYDELNLIKVGGNYGWPDSEGDRVAEETVGPVRHSTASVTWAPGGLLFYNDSLFIPGLRGETLYEAEMEGTEVVAWHEHLVGEYGRLRTAKLGPDGFIYVTTSNGENDKILKIDPTHLDRN